MERERERSIARGLAWLAGNFRPVAIEGLLATTAQGSTAASIYASLPLEQDDMALSNKMQPG